MQMQIITAGQIATKNGQLRPNLVVAIPSKLLSKYLHETQARDGFFVFFS